MLTNLTELTLCANELKVLPHELGKLTKLQILDVSYNPIKFLPLIPAVHLYILCTKIIICLHPNAADNHNVIYNHDV